MSLLNENEYALIDDFLAGRLPAVEAAKVGQRIATDATYAKEVEWMKSLKDLKHRRKSFEVLQMLEIVRRERRRRRNFQLILLMVLLLAAIVIALIFFTKQSPEVTPLPQHLPEQTEDAGAMPETPENGEETPPETPASLPETKQAPAPSSPPIAESKKPGFEVDQFVIYKAGLQTLGDESAAAEARLLLDQGEKLQALPLLEQYLASLTDGEEDFDLRLETGKIYLKELKDFKKAAYHFRLVAEGDVIARYQMEARFYLAVAHLAADERTKAKPLLETVAGSKIEPWNAKAASLLKQQ